MRIHVRFVALLAFLCLCATPLPAGAQNVVTIAGGLSGPRGLAIDGSGNLFVSESGNNTAQEIVAAGGYGTIDTFGGEFGPDLSVALDSQNNLFVADAQNNAVKELTAASGYTTVKTLGSGFYHPQAIAIDADGNVFVANSYGNRVDEILAAGGYVTVNQTIGGRQFFGPTGVAVDAQGNVFIATSAGLYELPVANGYPTAKAIATSIENTAGVALDKNGNLFVLQDQNNRVGAVFEVLATGGYTTVQTLVPALNGAAGITLDGAGNLFVANFGAGTVMEFPAANGYSASNTLGNGFSHPQSVAVDSSGNLFVADYGNAKLDEVVAADGYATVKTLGYGFNLPVGIAVDAQGDIFIADSADSAIKEIVAANGAIPAVPVVRTLGSGFNQPQGIAVDGSGNVFVTDEGDSVKEIPAADDYATVITLFSSDMGGIGGITVDGRGDLFFANDTWGVLGFLAVNGSIPAGTPLIGIGDGSIHGAQFVAVDRANNVYLTDRHSNSVSVVLAAGGYGTVRSLASSIAGPAGIAVDGNGTVFFVDETAGVVEEIEPPILAAAVLPGARSVQIGHTATFLASVINPGQTALDNCRIALPQSLSTYPPSASNFLTLNYQTTDPATNALIGLANTPTTLRAGSLQTFFFSLEGPYPLSAQAMPIDFICDGAPPAPYVPGIDTVDLVLANTPIADIIALAATPTNDGIVQAPNGGAAAFAVASTNVGVTDTITVSVDTGSAKLPVALNLCQTDRTTGQCQSAPAGSVTLSYAGGAAPTFSIFVQPTGSIAFAPAESRIFVRFNDAAGGLHGSTSVAVETQ